VPRDNPVRWPHGARVAVIITVDTDAELFWLRLDPSAATRPKTLSMGEYGMRRGILRVLDALRDYDVRATWFVPGRIAERYPAAIRAVADAGHELGCRGYDLESFHGLTADEQRLALRRGRDAVAGLTGLRPTGFRGFGDIGDLTLEILVEAGFTWCSSFRDDDRPVRLDVGGEPGIIDLPSHWELTDLPFFGFNYGPPFPLGQNRIASYSRVLQDWKEEFDAYRRYGLCYMLTLDPQSIGKPGRIGVLRELLAHIRSRNDVWLATGAEVAQFWRASGDPARPDAAELIRRRTAPRAGA
jgi:peptidoglycan/xylan/chitin deacetylase (PgdA/CDA1 family)